MKIVLFKSLQGLHVLYQKNESIGGMKRSIFLWQHVATPVLTGDSSV
jgi:hypothetical protein